MTQATPRKITVQSLDQSRYPSHQRPRDWGERKGGVDVVTTTSGQVLRLSSDGQQSPPQPGWVLMVSFEDGADTHPWTLYGIPPQS